MLPCPMGRLARQTSPALAAIVWSADAALLRRERQTGSK